MAPAVAFNGSVYVVAWHHEVNFTSYVVRLKRFNSAGEPLGSTQTITNAAYAQIASNGREFVILWRFDGVQTMTARLDANGVLIPNSILSSTLGDFPTIASNGSDYILYASWPTPAYRRLTPLGFGPLISIPTPSYATGAAIASDGTNYLAVWCSEEPNARSILGARIAADGTLIDSQPFEIAANVAYNPSIAFSNGIFLVTWQKPRSLLSDIYSKRIKPDGTIVDAAPIAISDLLGNEGVAAVGPFGDGFRAIWIHFETLDNGAESYDILSTSISTNGIVGPRTQVSDLASSAVQQVAITARGPNSFGVWTTYSGETAYDVFARFLPHDGPIGETHILERGPNVETAPAVAFGSNGYLVVWQDNRNSITNRDDIFGRFVDAFGRPKGPAAFPIGLSGDDQSSPVVAAAGDHYLVAWRQLQMSTTGITADIKGALLINDIIIKEFSISSSDFDQRAPAVASNDRDFLVVWRDNRDARQDDIYGMHVTRDGVLSGPENGFLICTNRMEQTAPAIASNGTNFLVVWRDDRNRTLTGDDIYGAIVEAGSTNLPVDFAVSAANSTQRAPDVASNGRDYFIVWRDDRDRQDSPATWIGIYGVPVSASGIVADANGFPLTARGLRQREPAIARMGMGNDYMLTWLEDSAAIPDIYNAYARSINSDGSTNSTILKLSNALLDEETLALAAGSDGLALMVGQLDEALQVIPRVRAVPFCLTNCPLLVTATTSTDTRTLTWNADAGQTYRIEYKNNLSDPTWQPLDELTASSDGFLQLSDSTLNPTRFYRIVRR